MMEGGVTNCNPSPIIIHGGLLVAGAANRKEIRSFSRKNVEMSLIEEGGGGDNSAPSSSQVA